MDFKRLRAEMVEQQIAARGIRDETILRAFREVPREVFVPEEQQAFAYEDGPLPIGEGQTISQPYIVALMTEALEPTAACRVLDVGTGSGYGAAVLSRIVAQVYSIERIPSLARAAEGRLRRLGYDNVRIRVGDGSLGWPKEAPFDAITVAAGGPEVPRSLLEQLVPGGRLLMPVGETVLLQTLVRVRRRGPAEFQEEDLGGVRFVPLIGAQGWKESGSNRERLF
jgi:protein-L-isoaspartate(D-aspartate) O-methyltransferase